MELMAVSSLSDIFAGRIIRLKLPRRLNQISSTASVETSKIQQEKRGESHFLAVRLTRAGADREKERVGTKRIGYTLINCAAEYRRPARHSRIV